MDLHQRYIRATCEACGWDFHTVHETQTRCNPCSGTVYNRYPTAYEVDDESDPYDSLRDQTLLDDGI